MDEFAAIMAARKLVKELNRAKIPVEVEAYAEHVGATLRQQLDLELDEPGFSFENKGKHFICVNANDSPERQRFTACHELGHIVLKLPSEHQAMPWWSYAKRSPNEIFCDIFAAELLLPYTLFKPIADKVTIGFASLDELASQFSTSRAVTGSRYASTLSAPCAFVLSEQGQIKYASRSPVLRDSKAWISPRTVLPRGSASEAARSGTKCEGPTEISADAWFSDWDHGGVLLEEAKHSERWDQTLTLLWFENGEIPSASNGARGNNEEREEDGLLEELDGNLRWPGKHRRR